MNMAFLISVWRGASDRADNNGNNGNDKINTSSSNNNNNNTSRLIFLYNFDTKIWYKPKYMCQYIWLLKKNTWFKKYIK